MALIWSNYTMEIPKFKLQTVNPIEKSKVENYFNPLIELNGNRNSELYLAKDGFLFKFINTEIENSLIVEIHCAIKPLEKSAGYNLYGLNRFLVFCQENQTEILNIQSGIEVQASEGALMSDFYTFFNSNKFRKAKHYLLNPKDRKE
ncbi:hypothetical protein [Winogradskyella eximia]|uniref:hypothetical protein n=1 Tax=Winogradskyella eximia TaxID=262006 RepID=UPI002491C7EE|nr:hypothetical protein [Winogradskyella eximia]